MKRRALSWTITLPHSNSNMVMDKLALMKSDKDITLGRA